MYWFQDLIIEYDRILAYSVRLSAERKQKLRYKLYEWESNFLYNVMEGRRPKHEGDSVQLHR